MTKRHVGFIVPLVAIFVVVAIALVSTGSWYVFRGKKTNSNINRPQITVSPSLTSSPSAAVNTKKFSFTSLVGAVKTALQLSPTPTPTSSANSNSPTATPTATPIATKTPAATATPTSTTKPTNSPTPAPIVTPTPTTMPTVTPTPTPKPKTDFIITNASVYEPPMQAAHWGSITVDYKNQGTATESKISNIEITITSSAGNQTSCELGMEYNIGPNQSATAGLDCIVYEPGIATAVIKVDANNQYQESNEDNNTYTLTFNVVP